MRHQRTRFVYYSTVIRNTNSKTREERVVGRLSSTVDYSTIYRSMNETSSSPYPPTAHMMVHGTHYGTLITHNPYILYWDTTRRITSVRTPFLLVASESHHSPLSLFPACHCLPLVHLVVLVLYCTRGTL